MNHSKVILNNSKFQLTLDRLSLELIENYGDFADVCIIGIQERGALFSDRIMQNLESHCDIANINYGKIDITFYRDDFRRGKTLKPSRNEMNFLVEKKKVILLDDVLYTGRTIQSAMTALQHFGRPESVELMVLVDRRFNRHLPIQPNYVGITVDAFNESYVQVKWGDGERSNQILFFDSKQ